LLEVLVKHSATLSDTCSKPHLLGLIKTESLAQKPGYQLARNRLTDRRTVGFGPGAARKGAVRQSTK